MKLMICVAACLLILLHSEAGRAHFDAADVPRRCYSVGRESWHARNAGEEVTGGSIWGSSHVSYAALIHYLYEANVILIGEQHDDRNTHYLEKEIVYNLFELQGGWSLQTKTALAMEMFERDVQPHIDSDMALPKTGLMGGSVEEDFLELTRAWSNYRTDYAPITVPYWAYKQPLVASNAPTPIARRVAKEGLEPVLASLTPEERGWVAETTTSPKDEYWQRFLEAMGGGASDDAHSSGMSEEQIYQYYQAQCLKDDTMAETIARLRAEDPQRQVVHLSGSFHIDYHLGIVPRLKQRRPNDKIVTVAIRPVANFDEATLQAALEAEPGVADYVVFVLKEEKAAAPPSDE